MSGLNILQRNLNQHRVAPTAAKQIQVSHDFAPIEQLGRHSYQKKPSAYHRVIFQHLIWLYQDYSSTGSKPVLRSKLCVDSTRRTVPDFERITIE